MLKVQRGIRVKLEGGNGYEMDMKRGQACKLGTGRRRKDSEKETFSELLSQRGPSAQCSFLG